MSTTYSPHTCVDTWMQIPPLMKVLLGAMACRLRQSEGCHTKISSPPPRTTADDITVEQRALKVYYKHLKLSSFEGLLARLTPNWHLGTGVLEGPLHSLMRVAHSTYTVQTCFMLSSCLPPGSREWCRADRGAWMVSLRPQTPPNKSPGSESLMSTPG